MELNITKFYTMEPMRYYQAASYINNPKVDEMLHNKDNKYIATKKYDGEFCRAIVDEDNKITLQSRSISKVTGQYGDKTNHVPHIVKELKSFPAGTVLLGELCFADITKTSKDVGSILRCKPDKAIARQKTEPLVFKVFDCLALAGIDLTDKPYWERWASANDAIWDYKHYITVTDAVEYDDFEEFLQEILAAGGEGIVIHRKDAKYKPGARTAWDTLKVKKIIEELELPIVDFIEPNKLYCGEDALTWDYWEGYYKDNPETKYKINHVPGEDDKELYMVWEPVTKPYWNGWKNGVVVNHNGTLVRVTSGLTDDDREWLATDEAREALKNGLIATVSAMSIDEESGSLRHPRLIRIRTEA